MNDIGDSSRHPFAPGPQDLAPRTQDASVLARFLGGAPAAVALRLVFLSVIVGFFLIWLDITPRDIFESLRDDVARIWAMGFDALRGLVDYFLAGAAVVIPLFLLLRLVEFRRRD